MEINRSRMRMTRKDGKQTVERQIKKRCKKYQLWNREINVKWKQEGKKLLKESKGLRNENNIEKQKRLQNEKRQERKKQRKQRKERPMRCVQHKFPCRLQTEHPIFQDFLSFSGVRYFSLTSIQIDYPPRRKCDDLVFISLRQVCWKYKVIRDSVLIQQLMAIIILCVGTKSCRENSQEQYKHQYSFTFKICSQ
jgi:hypothetical protein